MQLLAKIGTILAHRRYRAISVGGCGMLILEIAAGVVLGGIALVALKEALYYWYG